MKDNLYHFFLEELRFLETYTAAMKKDAEEGRYAAARHYLTEIASRAANMNGTLASLDERT